MRKFLGGLMLVAAGVPAWAAMPAFEASGLNAGAVVSGLRAGAARMAATAGFEAYDAGYYEIDPASIEHKEIAGRYAIKAEEDIFIPVGPPEGGTIGIPEAAPPGKPLPEPGKPLPAPTLPGRPGGQDINWDKVVNIGERIWKFIEANKPVINAASRYASAVPEGITHWMQLEKWDKPANTLYSFSAKNKAGKKVVDVTYMVLRTTGGSKDGKGKYLTGVTVLPISITALWGFSFDMDAEVPSVSNVGTAEDPVAGMTLHLKWKIKNNFKESQGAGVYYLQGDGEFRQLAGPFEANKSQHLLSLTQGR